MLEQFMSRARGNHGKEGPIAAARASENARRKWVRSQLVAAGSGARRVWGGPTSTP
ncbi:hypothetical protein ACFQ51_40230 [Streptomyces kaempferi]